MKERRRFLGPAIQALTAGAALTVRGTGTRHRKSFFRGAIGKVAIYLLELTPERIGSHCTAMVGKGQGGER
jgi:hypothetical protein